MKKLFFIGIIFVLTLTACNTGFGKNSVDRSEIIESTIVTTDASSKDILVKPLEVFKDSIQSI